MSLLIVLALAAGWFLFLRPHILAGPAVYVRVSGTSMEPTYKNGDLVLAIRQTDYQIGEVVAYRVPEGQVGEGALVLHRIVGGSASEGFVLRGDNRQGPDVWRPRPEDVDGRVMLEIPGAGRVLGFLGSPPGLALFAGLLTYVLVLWVIPAPKPARVGVTITR